jgi:endonuclease-8
MPEGDTIHRAAAKLRKVLEKQIISRAEGGQTLSKIQELVGQTVPFIEARGKHLMIHFSDQRVLHSHMGMTGSWHVYGHQEPWRKPHHYASVRLDTERGVAVCFTPKLIELVTATTLRRNNWLQRLGPDLLGPPISDRQLLSRFRTQRRQPIGESVMNQTVVSGIGNVYKSELLFLEQIHPLTPTSQVSDNALLSLRDRACKLMRRNLGPGQRRTRFRRDGPGLWVYDRQGEPCLVCGTLIQMLRQGDLARSTYFCPECQRYETSPRASE